MGFPGGTVVKESPDNAGDAQDLSWSIGQEDSLEWEMATHSTILAWRIPWIRSLVGYSLWGSQRVGHGWVTGHAWHKITVSQEQIQLLSNTVKYI